MKAETEKYKTFIQRKIRTDKLWRARALSVLAACQTDDERTSGTALYKNNAGLNKFDSEALRPLIIDLEKRNLLSAQPKILAAALTPGQHSTLAQVLPKYWRQILRLCDKEHLDKLMQQPRKPFRLRL